MRSGPLRWKPPIRNGTSRAWRPRPAGPGVGPDIAVVVATSGSTGQPKGTQLSAAALLASARASLHRIGAGPGERWLACLPAFHVAGLQVLVRSLLSGTEPVHCDRLTPGLVSRPGLRTTFRWSPPSCAA